jgi:D-arabinose 5-phosphate isomerase GutQ
MKYTKKKGNSDKVSDSELIALAQETIAKEADGVRSLVSQIGPEMIGAARMMLDCPGHILVAGAGTSRAVAQRFAHLLACCGTPAICISAADALHGGSGAVTHNDLVYIISKGGQSAEINGFARIAKDRGAKIVAHTEKPQSELATISDAVVVVKAAEGVDPYGMIATGSSLANSAACDALCILLLKLRGYTKDQFGQTHPGGAVGKKIELEKR